MRWNGQAVIGIWLILSLASCARAQQANPAWFSQPQFVTYNGGLLLGRLGAPIQITGSSIGDDSSSGGQVPWTGEMFGVDLYQTPDSNSEVQQEVNAWKSRGGFYFFAADLLGARADSSAPPDWDAFRMRNINGMYLNPTAAWYSLSSPVFQSALKAAALRAVDLGADGTDFDNCPVPASVMFPALGGGSFDTVTMGAFRTYLQQNYSAVVLLSQFGIADITTFDYGVYIQANSLTGTWNNTPLTGLAREFFFFKRQESLDFLRDVVSSIKQYAQQKYGRDFLFNCNVGDAAVGFYTADVLDLGVGQLQVLGMPASGGDHPFAAVDVKAWQGWKNAVAVLPWVPSVPGPTVNLERVLIADVEAAGGMPGAQEEINDGVGNNQPIDLSVVQRYANFILNNPQLMAQTTTPAQTLVVESAASLLNAILSGPNINNSSYSDYFGTGRLLLDSGITYNSIFLPDTSIAFH